MNLRISRRLLLSAAVSVSAVFVSLSAIGAGIADRVTVNDPYIRAVPPVVKTSAAFLQMRSDNPQEQFLVDATTPVAATVELHTHENDDGVMRMRRIAHVHLPSGKTVSLQPGGLHIMLFDLKGPLREGQQVPITLSFDDGSTKEITAVVKSVKRMMQH